MDVLSDVIMTMRTGRPHSGRGTRSAPWSRRLTASEGAGFHVVLRGGCRLVPERGEPVVLGPGDVAFLPHGTAHELTDAPAAPAAADGGRHGPETVLLCGAYLLDRSRAHPLLSELPEVIHLPASPGRGSPLRAAVDLLASELEERRAGADAAIPALLDTLLISILRTWYDEHADHGWAAALRDRGISAALRAIHDDPARGWTVAELGARAGLSRAAFARRFTALVGRPPLSYLTWWRLTLAARLLTDTDAPLAAIAKRVGYGSPYAFANAFKREYGLAPGRYRLARSLPARDGDPVAEAAGTRLTAAGRRAAVRR
ncbi:AraC family transcriptional regulator [Thermostaphylospora chromogena]|uniref:AraC-type DNA-binding protein n=1 Tax=Thermostaphylospora chromogena TaxID=35622 RepID=A0A1H1D810_9ACTN|nr:AraC family transcriptional regulator [Thermostaphylospora chromogena]SDQ72582.1 AraC-type DNA-binding protein [Thermostaphylospora chromogena]